MSAIMKNLLSIIFLFISVFETNYAFAQFDLSTLGRIINNAFKPSEAVKPLQTSPPEKSNNKNSERQSLDNENIRQTTNTNFGTRARIETPSSGGDRSKSDNDRLRTVIAIGLGNTAESASKNAAENALTQVVGTFIDTEKQVSKRKEIRDGIQKLTKVVSSRTSEFSQGSIANFKVLNVETDGTLSRVEAEVVVRISEFKAYVKELSSDEVSIGSNVFAQVAVSERNSNSAKDILISKIIIPLLKGESSVIKTEDPIPYDQLNEDTRKLLKSSAHTITPTTVVIPILIKLKDDFLSNAISTFEEIASKKDVLDYNINYGTAHCSDLNRFYENAFENNGIAIELESNRGASRVYAFYNILHNSSHISMLPSGLDKFDPNKKETWNMHYFGPAFYVSNFPNGMIPKLNVKIKDANGYTLFEEINPSSKEMYLVQPNQSSINILNIGQVGFNGYGCGSNRIGIAIIPERRLNLLLNFTTNVLQKIRSVEVGYTYYGQHQ